MFGLVLTHSLYWSVMSTSVYTQLLGKFVPKIQECNSCGCKQLGLTQGGEDCYCYISNSHATDGNRTASLLWESLVGWLNVVHLNVHLHSNSESGQGHWGWHGWGKLSWVCHPQKLHTSCFYSIWENVSIKVFTQTAHAKHFTSQNVLGDINITLQHSRTAVCAATVTVFYLWHDELCLALTGALQLTRC